MSDEEEGAMGSTLVGPTIEDVDDVDLPSSHVIHIHEPDTASASTTATATAEEQLSLLDEKFSLLLAAHSREAAAVSARMDALEALKLGSLMAEAASSAASSASAAAQSAEAAYRLIEKSEEAVETAAAVMEATRTTISAFGSDGNIQSILSEHCVNAALSARNSVLEAIDDVRGEAEEFVQETTQRAEQAAASTGKRGGAKKK